MNMLRRACKSVLIPAIGLDSIPSFTSTLSFISLRRESRFVAPARPTLKSKHVTTQKPAVEGREDPEIFSSEYIPRQVLPEWHRNNLKYRLERMDCLRRRQVIDIPEFYAGSIVRVIYSDKYSVGKFMKFAGRVLYRDGFGMDCHFCLRNILNGEGIEVVYPLYSPLIQKIEVLRLEKWIDTDLRYLRDADDQGVCTIDIDMAPEAILPNSETLPAFDKKIKLRQRRTWGWKFHRAWPEPQNAYLAEHFVTEELTMNQRFIDTQSWRKFDICRHHDFIQEKKDVMKEMKINKLRIKAAKEPKTSTTDS